MNNNLGITDAAFAAKIMNFNKGLVIVTGPMFSGKSTLLIEAYTRLGNLPERDSFGMIAITPKASAEFTSRNNTKLNALFIQDGVEAVNHIEDVVKSITGDMKYIVFMDEAQLFIGNPNMMAVRLLNLIEVYNITFIIGGLDLSHRRSVFPIMGALMPHADIVLKMDGGQGYRYSVKVSGDFNKLIELGAEYEPKKR